MIWPHAANLWQIAPMAKKKTTRRKPKVVAPRRLRLGSDAQHLIGQTVSNPSRQALAAHLDRIAAELERARAEGLLTAAEERRQLDRAKAALAGQPLPGDDRTPLVIDGQTIALLDDPDDGKRQLVTLKLPRVIVERLRDAAAMLQPQRTMAGLASVALQQLLDQLEAELLTQTGLGIPQRPESQQVLKGGRPQKLTRPAGRKRSGG